jgi:hypothetical protein
VNQPDRKKLRAQANVLVAALLFVVGIPQLAAAAAESSLAQTVAQLDRARILKLAGRALKEKPPAITDHIATNSAGGPHDYFSQGDYYWPNVTNATGLPFVGRDGESNPNTFNHHRMAMRDMRDAVAALAAAYAITGDDRYPPKAAEFIRVFFLDAQTRMNPNMDYAQAVLGVSKGNAFGVIDGLHLAEVAMAARFLEKSPAFDPAVNRGLKQWFADFVRWTETSTNGVKEMNAANNHSIACFVQLASFARYTGDEKLLDLCRRQFREVLFPRQMAVDGSFPLEMKRTKPYGYSIFQADNLSLLCVLLSTPENDFWTYRRPGDGQTPLKSIEFIYPYLLNKRQWVEDGHRQDVMHWRDWPVRQCCLLFAYAETGDQKYFALWKRLEPDPHDLEVRRNLAVTQPVLWIASPGSIPLLKRR